MPFNFVPPTELQGRGLTLRALAGQDWQLEYDLSRTADVPRWTYYPVNLDQSAARARIGRTEERRVQRVAGRYAVLEAGVALGMVGIASGEAIEPEIFYALLATGRGRGAATRSVLILTDWLFGNGIERVALETIHGNTASERVARRAGFLPASSHQGEQHGVPVELQRWVCRRG